MSLDLTQNAKFAAGQVNVEPQMVLKIDGYPTLFGVAPVEAFIKIGDTNPDLLIGDDWVIGGIRRSNPDTQKALISLKDGTTTSINTQLFQDRGGSSSISQINIALIDLNESITQLITPGKDLTDILMTRATVYLGFQGTSFPEDFVRIFKGPITDVSAGPGIITLTISHPDQKKRQQIFNVGKAKVQGALSNVAVTIPVDDTSTFLVPSSDGALLTYVRIDDEIIRYTGKTSNSLTGCTRAQFGTLADVHGDQSDVATFYRLQGTMIDLALKLMLSGVNGPFVEDIPVTNFVAISSLDSNPQAVYFKGVDVFDEYGLTVGDKITTSGAVNGGNNFVERTITAVKETEDGSYVLVDGAPLTLELTSTGLAAFRSKYDTLGEGLRMTPDDVDVLEHRRLDDLVGAGVPTYDFYLKNEINGKDFIEKELLYPAAFYAIPRKSRSSLGATLPPIAVGSVKIIDSRNVIKPSTIQVKRGISRNFYNTVVYKYDDDPLEDKFRGGTITTDADSQARIPYGNKVMTIESKGLRSTGSANLLATLASQRLLDRYKYAAEYFEGVKVHYRDSFNIEVGDIVVFGSPDLGISDTKSGKRAFSPRAFEVTNVRRDIKGTVALDMTDTGFSLRGRYGIVGPSSMLLAGSTSSTLVITESFGRVFPDTEPEKWTDYVGQKVLVHDENWAHSAETTFTDFDPGNPYHLRLSPPLPFTPGAGYKVEMPKYGDSTDLSNPENTLWKVLHVFTSPQVPVATGISQTQFTVAAGQESKFFVGSVVRIHSENYSADSGELRVTAIAGTTITLDKATGFAMNNTHLVDYIGFANDSGDPYRYTQ
jgi:hypothetical protein